MKKDEKTISPAVANENGPVTSDEKAQYEVFRNGKIDRETIAKWTRADIQSANALLSACWREESVFQALVDSLFAKYQALHQQPSDDVQKTAPESGD